MIREYSDVSISAPQIFQSKNVWFGKVVKSRIWDLLHNQHYEWNLTNQVLQILATNAVLHSNRFYWQ